MSGRIPARGSSLTRRAVVGEGARALAGAALLLAGMTGIAREARGQAGSAASSGTGPGSTDPAAMNQGAARTVRRPPKPNARPSMTPDARDALERGIRCQCGCTLDVFTCRTTDFACQVSPAMHRDILALVDGGYSAQEIVDAFVVTYGERALMAPKKEGFNWAGYVVPFAVMGAGAIALTQLLRRWSSRAATAAAAAAAQGSDAGRSVDAAGEATPEELARLAAAVRGEG